MKRKILVIVSSILFVIFSTLSVIGYIEHNKDNKSNSNDDNKVVDNEDSNIKNEINNDENNSNEDETNHDNNINDDDKEYIEEKELFIYFDNKNDRYIVSTNNSNNFDYEYIDSYKYTNYICEYFINGDIFVIYDNNKVLYKDLTKKEDFKESKIEKIYKYYDKYQKEDINIKSYKILDNNYYMANDELCSNINTFEVEYSDNEIYQSMCTYYNFSSLEKYILIENGYPYYITVVYDINKEKIVHSFDEDLDGIISSFYKEGDFYIVGHPYGQESIFLSNFKNVTTMWPTVSTYGRNYYIKNNILYYIEENKLNVIDKDNNIVDYPNKDIIALSINSSYLLYLDKDNLIKIKNLDDDKIIVDSNIELKEDDYKLSYIGENGNFYIAYSDITVRNTKKWKDLVKKYDDYEVYAGYLLEFDKNNKLLKKEIGIIYWSLNYYNVETD
ncbi:MAG: hypothetical protein ACI33S_02485 [Bacilli bacterium]